MLSWSSMARLVRATLVVASCIACTACSAQIAGDDGDPETDGGLGAAALAPGGLARVTATSLNLRAAAGTSATVEASMPCGTQLAILDGPSATPVAGWWNVRWDGATNGAMTGW